MAKVILSLEGRVVDEYPLSKERTTIGRRAHNDIAIDNLAISGEHAVIVTILNDSFLEDLGSTNGTLVNGAPIKKHFLQNADCIELGKYTLQFFNELGEQPAALSSDFEKTMVFRPPAAPKPVTPAPEFSLMQDTALRSDMPAGLPPAPPEHPTIFPPSNAVNTVFGEERVGVVQILNGGNAGRELDLVKPITTVGRPGVQVAIITKRPQGYFITHVDGLSYPMLNGVAVGSEPHALQGHDIIEISGVKMEFFYR